MPFAFDNDFDLDKQHAFFAAFHLRSRAYFQFVTLRDDKFIRVVCPNGSQTTVQFYVCKGNTQTIAALACMRDYCKKLELLPFYGIFYDYHSVINDNPTVINFEAKDTDELFAKVVSCFIPIIRR